MPILTVLDHADNKPQTKNFETGATYAKSKQVLGFEQHTFHNTKGLKKILQLLAARSASCVIRGEPGADLEVPCRRNKSNFTDTAQAWVMLDIDKLAAPKHLRALPYTDEHAAYAASTLPDAFQGVSCVWQASASAGKDPKVLKLHLWYLLDRPLTAAELRVWLKGAAIDPSTLRCVQPHYTADPIGADWYVGPRIGRLRGALRRVPVPDFGDVQEHASSTEMPLRPDGCVDIARETIERALKAATRRAQAELDNSSVVYQSAYTIGTILGPSVAMQTWNDAEHGHETWRQLGATSAEDWATKIAALPGAHPYDVYYARVYSGIEWGVARERERLSLQSQKSADAILAATKSLRESLLRKAGRNVGSLQKMQQVARELGKYVHLQKREDVVAMLAIESGFSEQQVSDALEAGEANPVDASAWREGLLFNAKRPDEIEAVDSNLLQIYESYPGFKNGFRFNVRTKQLEAQIGNPLGIEGNVNFDALPGLLVTWLKSIGCAKAGLNGAYATFRAAMHGFTKYDPFIELFPECEWLLSEAAQAWADMPHKLDTWLIDHFGCKDTPYVRMVGAKALISAVARAVNPGAQVDTLLILQGAEGIGKTQVLKRLGNVVTHGYQELLDMRDKDAVIAMNDGLIVEVSELKALRYTNEETAKAFFSRQRDRLRAPYARAAEDYDRRIIFVGTTNDHEFLGDGRNRRYWPVKCVTSCKMTKKQARALWREAALRYACGEQWWLEGAEERELQLNAVSQFRMEDVLEVVLAPWLKHKDAVKMLDVLSAVPERYRAQASPQRIGRVLRQLGFAVRSKRRIWVRERRSGGGALAQNGKS